MTEAGLILPEAPRDGSSSPSSSTSHIREVWAHNLEEEMDRIRDIADMYPYIAMDTEFPGVVARPVGPFRDGPDYNYQRIKCNVDLLKVIQIGLTFSDPDGRLPTEEGHPYNTWQFNFKFDLGYDLYAADSVQFLQNSGIDFVKHFRDGIDATLFGELLMSSGIVLSDEVRWIAFQGKYDFGYLIKILTCDVLPNHQDQFFELLHTYFPNIYDIKWLLHHVHHELEEQVVATNSSSNNSQSPTNGLTVAVVEKSSIIPSLPRDQKDKGLEDLAKTLGISRVGTAHQAGSDSLLTSQVFFRLVHRHLPHVLNGNEDDNQQSTSIASLITTPTSRHRRRSSSVESDGIIIEKHNREVHLCNVLHGLGRGYIPPEREHRGISTHDPGTGQKSSIVASPTTAAAYGTSNTNTKSMIPFNVKHGIAPPPLSGAIRLSADTPAMVLATAAALQE